MMMQQIYVCVRGLMGKKLPEILLILLLSTMLWGAATTTCSSCGGGTSLGVPPDYDTCQAISLTGSANNWSPTNFQTNDCFIVASDGAHQMTGLVAPSPESQAVKWFYTTSTSTPWRFNNDSGSSTAANRVLVPGATSQVSFFRFTEASWIMMMYIPTLDRWTIVNQNNEYYE